MRESYVLFRALLLILTMKVILKEVREASPL